LRGRLIVMMCALMQCDVGLVLVHTSVAVIVHRAPDKPLCRSSWRHAGPFELTTRYYVWAQPTCCARATHFACTQVPLARDIMSRNEKGQPVHRLPRL
jgi:hypothetical protein